MNEQDTLYLELGLGTFFYNSISEIILTDFINYSAFSLLNSHLGIGANSNCVKYKILDNKYNLLIISMAIENIIEYITVENELNSVIIDLCEAELDNIANRLLLHSQYSADKITNFKDIKRFLYTTIQNKNAIKYKYWQEFIYTVYNIIKKFKPDTWQRIDSTRFIIMHEEETLSFYGKRTLDGKILLGFGINTNEYNYFTNEYSSNNISKSNSDTISKLYVKISDKTYAIDTSDTTKTVLRIYLDTCIDSEGFCTKDLKVFKTDDYVIVSANEKIRYIVFKKKHIPDIMLEDNQYKEIKFETVVNKMHMLDIDVLDKTYFNNIQIYKGIIPNVIINVDNILQYDYAIQFTRN